MPKYMKNFITLASLIIIGSFLAFLYNCIVGLADFAGRFNPVLEPWVFWALFLSVAGMLGWMGAMAFMRPKPMMVYADPSDEDRAVFRRELFRRLKKNRLLRDAEVVINDEADMNAGLAYLKEKADEEIQATAKRVFIGTAVSQNGRLDSLVVLFLITRLSWRIAKIYNQRPHHRELINLFANIGATTFLAGSIEEFGIEEYVAELMGPLVGGSAIGAVPGAQAIAGTITSSVLTGTTNCLLALRCGIVARDYMSLNLDSKGAMRRLATVEAAKVFMTMSAETVTYVTKALVKGTAGAVKSGSVRTAKGVGETITGTADAVGSGARKVGRGVKGAADAVGDGAKRVGESVKDTAGAVGEGAKMVRQRVKDTADAIKDGAAKGVQAARRMASKATEDFSVEGRRGGTEAEGATGKAMRAGKEAVGAARDVLRRIRMRNKK